MKTFHSSCVKHYKLVCEDDTTILQNMSTPSGINPSIRNIKMAKTAI